MAALDTQNIALQPTMMSPQQHVDDNNDDIFGFSSTSSALPLNSSIRITRMFDIRRVHNSDTELRLSLDVPTGTTASDLKVQMEHDKEMLPDVYTLRISGTNYPIAKTFPLNAESIELQQMQAVLSTRNGHNVLEVIAPKQRASNSNPLLMAVEALQAMALSMSSSMSSWSSTTTYRDVPIVEQEIEMTF